MIRALWLPLAVALAAAAPLAAAQKWALLIGVNDYVKGPDHWDLKGCENDVAMTRELLVTKFGFPEENIKVLLSTEATVANIRAAVEDWLIARSRPEDIAYFHFSGHGSQLKDRDGDEDDGKDEMICPTDMEPGKVESILTDDQLSELFARIPANNVTIVLDACHSGTGTRDITRSRPRFVEFDPGLEGGSRAIVVSSTSGSSTPVAAPQAGEKEEDKLAGSGGMEGGGKLQVTISGCKPEQTSADAWIDEGFYAGALTYHLIENMKKTPAEISYRELMKRVERDIKAAQYEQTPQIEGDMDRPLFGTPIAEAVEEPFLVVRAVAGEQITLGGGRAQNVTRGSIYAVFPEGETLFAGTGLGRIRIAQVFQTHSLAVPLDSMQVRPGYRAREVLWNLSLDPLKLRVEDGGAGLQEAIAAPLARINFVKVVDPGQHFDQRLQVSVGSGGWRAFLVRDGIPGAPVDGRSAADLVAALRPHLENAYAIKFLAVLDNPNPPFRVKVWANHASLEERGLKKLEQAPDEKLVEAGVGDAIRFNFRAERNCYLTLVNVGTSGRITVLFPNQYQPDGFVEKDRTYRTETRGEMPFVIRAKGPAGRELVKVIATLEPLDLSSLRMGESGGYGTRTIESGSRFVRQLARDLAGSIGGDETLLLPTDTWTTDYLIVETGE